MATTTDSNIFYATGRRKTAVARVRIKPGVGKIFVNGKEFSQYFTVDAMRAFIEQPLDITEKLNEFDIYARVHGGGTMGQACAMRHGISRALVSSDEELREPLKSSGCLTRDPRMKERKKPGQPGARKRFQFSKR